VHRKRVLYIAVAAAVLVAGGVGAGVAVSDGSFRTGPASTAAGTSSIAMMGGVDAPSWMRGGSLPASMTARYSSPVYMMGGTSSANSMVMGEPSSGSAANGSYDPGKVMGAGLADAAGPRVAATAAVGLGDQIPVGASVNAEKRTVTFSATRVILSVLAGPKGGPDQTFRVAGMVDPAIVVPLGAHVTMQVINADPDMAHGLVVTARWAASTWMPMMTLSPAFANAAVWVLGNPTSAGDHAGTVRFTANTAGSYQYLCPVPGHALQGMVGSFIVTPS
jgi:rusticyanin